jgi:hypothetical protein
LYDALVTIAATDELARLRDIIGSSPWLMRVLATVRDVAVREATLPDAWVGAGVIRDLVWGQLYGRGFDPADVNDVDVAYFDADDLSWQARNQAAVHTWYALKFGGDPVEPLRSVADAVATWPETATALAVRLDPADHVVVCAPLGLTDLLSGIWRRNPRRVSLDVSLARLARHKPAERWPGVQVIPPR